MSLAALERSCPTWAEFRRIHVFEAEVDVVATRRSGAFTRVFELTVVESAGEIAVSERPVGKTLPACCPDRTCVRCDTYVFNRQHRGALAT